MSRLKESIVALLEMLTAKWLWLPIFFFLSLLTSLYLGVLLGFYGFFLPYIWVYYLFIRRVIREYCILPKSEAWETNEKRRKELMEYVEKERKKDRPPPP